MGVGVDWFAAGWRWRRMGRRAPRRASFALFLVVVGLAAWLAPVALGDTTAGTPIAVPGISLSGIACPSTTSCLAVGAGASAYVVVPITNGRPGTPIPVTGGSAGLQLFYIGCSTASNCVAVGFDSNGGVVVPIANGAPGTPIEVAGTHQLNRISCAPAGPCLATGIDAADGTGVVVPVTGGSPGAVTPVAGTGSLNGVSCPSTTCDAVGQASGGGGAVVTITGGVPGIPADPAGVYGFESVACVSTSSCEAVGANFGGVQMAMPITGGVAGASSTIAAVPISVACASSTVCEVVGENADGTGAVVPITSGAATSPILLDVGKQADVACPSATDCESVGGADITPLTISTGPSTAGPTRVALGKVSLSGTTAAITLSCAAAAPANCAGSIIETIRASVGRGRHHHTVDETVATDSYSIAAGQMKTASLKLNKTGRSALAKADKLKVTLTVRLGSGNAAMTVASHTLTLKANKRTTK